MAKKWTPEKIATLRALYPTTDTHEVAALVGMSHRACMVKACELKIKKEKHAKRTWTAHTELPPTWGFGKDPGKYTRGRPSPNRRPVGSEFTSKKGEVYVKVAMTGRNNEDWRRKSHVVWEQYNGRKLRADEVVSFLDGDSTNLSPENLVVKTKREIMADNSLHNYPKEIGDMYRAVGQIKRAVNRSKKK